VPKRQAMVDLSLPLLHHLQGPASYAAWTKHSGSSSVGTLIAGGGATLSVHELVDCRYSPLHVHCPWFVVGSRVALIDLAKDDSIVNVHAR